MQKPEDVLRFWLDECQPSDWYRSDPEFDAQIRDQFESTWEAATAGALSLWLTYPSGALAYIILTDQFPRNMFRGEGKAFSTDGLARAAAKVSIDRHWDMRIDEPARQFFYLPLMHSECLSDQDRAVRLICTRMPETGDSNLLHAKAHREVIRTFGRFPYRNAALDRKITVPEAAYLEKGGYGYTVRSLQAVAE